MRRYASRFSKEPLSHRAGSSRLPPLISHERTLRRGLMSHPTAAKLLDEAIALAGELGYSVCQEFLDGVGGQQPSKVGGAEWIVLDRQQSTAQRLERLVQFIEQHADHLPPMSPELRVLFPHPERQAA